MTGEEEPAVKVTLGKIYDKLLEVDKKVDPIPAAIVDHETRLRALERAVLDPETLKDVEVRLRSLERQMWRWVGGLTVLYLVTTAVVHFAHL